jgi:hypothetical protein
VWAVKCISITAHEQAQSNRACNIFIFVVFGGFQSSLFIYFNMTVALFVPSGGCEMSPRTFNQCCYQLRPLKVVLMYLSLIEPATGSILLSGAKHLCTMLIVLLELLLF